MPKSRKADQKDFLEEKFWQGFLKDKRGTDKHLEE